MFWDIKLKSPAEVYRRYERYCLLLQGGKLNLASNQYEESTKNGAEDEGRYFLRNFGKYLPHYKASHGRRQYSSQPPQSRTSKSIFIIYSQGILQPYLTLGFM
jgi:hypothetical protein